jgi:hypothetical protein
MLGSMDTKDRQKAAPPPVSRGIARSAAALRIQRKVIEQEAKTLRDAMGRVQGRHKGYVMARAAGDSQGKAWSETMTTVKDPTKSGHELESRSPAVRVAIEAATDAALRGSLMTVAQRRDYVLDRLVVESTAGGDSARIQALVALGKTANMFTDRAEISVTGGSEAIAQRIKQMIEAIQGRTIEHDHIYMQTGLNGADDVNADEEANGLNESESLNSIAQPIDSEGETEEGTGNADPTGEAPPQPRLARSPTI